MSFDNFKYPFLTFGLKAQVSNVILTVNSSFNFNIHLFDLSSFQPHVAREAYLENVPLYDWPLPTETCKCELESLLPGITSSLLSMFPFTLLMHVKEYT